jgi:osmotically-inducible protein OsmY
MWLFSSFILEEVVKKFLFIPAICVLCVSCDSNSDNPNGNNQMQSQPSDWDITANVKKNLMTDNSLSSSARMISVTTNSGVVTLTGTVASKDESRKVVRIVQNVPGVTSVDNQLTISSS